MGTEVVLILGIEMQLLALLLLLFVVMVTMVDGGNIEPPKEEKAVVDEVGEAAAAEPLPFPVAVPLVAPTVGVVVAVVVAPRMLPRPVSCLINGSKGNRSSSSKGNGIESREFPSSSSTKFSPLKRGG